MSNVRDRVKQAIRNQLLARQGNPSKYRLGVATILNSDGTCLVMVDGVNVVARPLYPTVVGQQVIVVFGDKGGVSAVPTRPNSPNIDISTPPFFSGKTKLRYVADESFAIPPGFNNSATLRFQDEGSSTLYRFVVPDLVSVSGSILQGSRLSPNGQNFSSVFQYSGVFNPRAYKIGSKLVSAGVIDPINLIDSFTSPTLLRNYSFVFASSITRSIVDTWITDSGDLYILDLIASGNTFVIPFPLPDLGGSGCAVLQTFNGFSQGGGRIPDFTNSIGINDVVGSANSYTYNLSCPPSISFPSLPSWLSIVASSGTVDIPGFNTAAPFDHVMTINTSGLAAGLYSATINTSSPSGPGEIIVYVAINASGSQTFRISKVVSNSSISPIAAAVSPGGTTYSDARILNIASNHIVVTDGGTVLKVVDLSGGTFNVIQTISYSAGIFFPAGEFFCNTNSETYSIVAVGNAPGTPVGFIRENVSTKVVDFVKFTNTTGDIGSNSTISLIMSSGTAGFMYDSNFVARKVTGSGASVTAAALPGISDISPGQTNPSVWRQLNFTAATACFGLVQS